MSARRRCPECRHLLDNHWPTRGCFTQHCDCRLEPPPPPAWSCQLGLQEVQQLLVMAVHGQRAVAAAVVLVETFPGVVLPDLRAHNDVAAGAAALADLLNALRGLLEHGALDQPARRWTLGIPPGLVDDTRERRSA